ncbi:unnamed protein product [Brassicogethes aeneus]|uniref:Bromo domain-containing protein n=1 Tax=Brassicogethes aeneus TaxID=1431903 RepID=A0A9P0FFE3_BRAAE|nr:unnamed protein product [Brassicogethes aeneus]
MVNTRRMESIGSSADIGTRHRTRGTAKEEVSVTEESSSIGESDSEDPNIDEDEPSDINDVKPKVSNIKKKPTISLPASRIKTFRDRKYSRPTRSTRRLISRGLFSRKMDSESELDENDFDEDVYSRRSRNKRHSKSHMARIERRTALSLRPISQKCYNDETHSPLHFNSDSEDVTPGRRGVRRSKRKTVHCRSASWLADDQINKVGYPTLNAEYSEEDSRDAPEEQWQSNKRITRHSNGNRGREIKNPKYLYDYQTNQGSPRRRRVASGNRELGSRRESNDKENKEGNLVNGRSCIKNGKEEAKEEEGEDLEVDSEEQSNEAKNLNEQEDAIAPKEEKNNVQKENKLESESEDDNMPLRRRTRNRNNNMIPNQEFSPRITRKKKIVESSSESEEEGPKYSLRERAPKPIPKQIQLALRARTRRRFNRRRAVSGGSSSSSPSSSEVRHNKPKPPKSPHSKNERMKSGVGNNNIAPLGPEVLDASVRFNSVGGLDSHVQCLKEMILLPMMYPEVFKQFQIQPPRGVLFHGPPGIKTLLTHFNTIPSMFSLSKGTGKTLIARALANECSFGSKKVSFFLRKGADLLSKWVGESEKQLRLLFSQASEMKPSIIFFDELDGLAPVRSAKQDQHHASIVSTLLALMDGLDSRGEIIVIGATNRIDAIDPALRRPGRFDRELFFPLPSRNEREEILNVNVAKWTCQPSKPLISYLAESSVGYCGSDLRALCSEAVIQSFRRTYPQVYSSDHRLLLNPENVRVEKVDFLRAKSVLVPASHRQAQGLGKKLLPNLEPLLKVPLKSAFDSLKETFPHGANSALAKVKISPNVRPAQLLITGNGSEHGQTCYLAPALIYQMEHIHTYLLDLATLYQETGRSAEEACIQIFNEARRNVPSIVYIPSINRWWELVSETVRAILIMQLSKLEPNIPILFLATSEEIYGDLPEEVQNIFSVYRKEVHRVEVPSAESRSAFFKPLIIDSVLRPPRVFRERPKSPPPLPRAPTPPPTPLTELQSQKLYETEEHTLRELRIFLRDICRKLANNKLFYMFTKPVDTEEVPDYTTIIKQPMDLETMMTKVDFHRYECAKDFLNDIELICQNALEYNPARSSADKQIRHRACSLRDYAYTLIKSEMDTDFEDKCQGIATTRKFRKVCTTKFLPPYIKTPENQTLTEKEKESAKKNNEENGDKSNEVLTPAQRAHSPNRKRRFKWQKGFIQKPKRAKMTPEVNEKTSTGDESKEVEESDKPVASLKGSSSQVENGSATSDTTTSSTTAPLTINCDTQPLKMDVASPLQSPKRRLSLLLSPSELLDSPLDFDDVDQALNESVEGESKPGKPIECPLPELEKVLDQAVKATSQYSLMALLDLYNHLNGIIKKYSRTHLRTALPKDMMKELIRFKKERSMDNHCPV